MEYKLKKISDKAQVDLKITFNSNDLKTAFEKVYHDKQKLINLPGFRKGKAPLELVKKYLGESVTKDAIEQLLGNFIQENSRSLEFPIVRYPQFNIDKYETGKLLIATTIYDTSPEIQLSKFKKIKINLPKVEISESNIQDKLKEIQKEKVGYELKDENEKVELNDSVDLEYSLRVESDPNFTPVVNQKLTKFWLDDKNNLKEFSINLVSLKVGEEKEFSVQFPEDKFDPELRGKEGIFKVKVTSIYKIKLPELNDDFANEYDGSQSLEELKNKIKKEQHEFYNNKIKEKSLDNIFNQIIQDSKYTFPEFFIQEEMKYHFENLKKESKLSADMSLEEFSKLMNKQTSEIEKQFELIATKRLQNYFTRQKIAELEDIKISEEEYSLEFEKIANIFGNQSKTTDEMNKMHKKFGDNIRMNLLNRKIDDYIFDSVTKKYTDSLDLEKLEEYLKEGNK